MTGVIREGELELINKYTGRELGENEVYAFSVVLCDNEIDRDFERFSPEALEKLGELFVGVTGLMDHDPKSGNQSARIFSCSVRKIRDRMTSDGKPYARLEARAYIPVHEGSRTLISELDGGIKKEVSVGCSVRRRICSVCGGEYGSCGHIKGTKYKNRLCFATLEDPTDAYEWSFVAVPAQKQAGVIKNYTGGTEMDIEKRLFEGCPQTFTADEMNILAEKYRQLNEKAADGEAYRRKLERMINKTAAVALPGIKKDILDLMIRNMNASQLEELYSAFAEKAGGTWGKPQLSAVGGAADLSNREYTSI